MCGHIYTSSCMYICVYVYVYTCVYIYGNLFYDSLDRELKTKLCVYTHMCM